MKRIDYLAVDHHLHDKKIEIAHGDLSDMTLGEDVDLLVVSAYPDDYSESPDSVIGALGRKGLHVGELAEDKELDLRENYSCWISKPLNRLNTGLRFKRILCYENALHYPSAAAGIEDVFRALAPFVGGAPHIRSAAMPLIGCGDQGFTVEDLVDPLVRTAVRWMQQSNLHHLRVVEYSRSKAEQMNAAFAGVKDHMVNEQHRAKRHDFFLSYSQKDDLIADQVEENLMSLSSGVTVFRDKRSLPIGREYDVKLEQGIRESRRFLQLLSPNYLASKPCQEEFGIAWSIYQRSDPGFFSPQMIAKAKVADPRMATLQYDDRIYRGQIRDACERMLEQLARKERLE